MSRGAKCRRCGYPIRFVKIAGTGSLLPVNPAPDDDGNVLARTAAGNLHGHVRRKGEALPDGWHIYMPHHATCPAEPRRKTTRPLYLFDDPPIEQR